jgi:hypothetical protein
MTGETGLKRIAQKRASRSKTCDFFGAPRPPENWNGNKRAKTRWRQGGGGYKPEIFAPIIKRITRNRKTRRKRAKQAKIDQTQKLAVAASRSQKRSIEEGRHLGGKLWGENCGC